MRRHLCVTTSVAASLLAVLAVGCADESLPQPKIPPVQSMSADLTGLESAPPLAKQANPAGITAYTNFANAWVRVKLLQLYALGVVAIPATVIGLALGQQPTNDGDQWVWDVSAGNASASLRFRGNVVAGWDVDLLVTNAEVEDFLWVEGDSNGTATKGSWVLHDARQPINEDQVLEIAWAYGSDTDYSLEYRNISQGSEDLGDELEYTLDGTTATVVFRDASDTTLVATISWNTGTGAGSIQVPGYNDGDEACWGTDFNNADCP